MQHSPVKRPAISECSRCGRTEYTHHLVFKQNVSYFFARKEREFSGDFCFSCASRMFAKVELTTLIGTWWGIIGFWVGPLYIVHNLVEYIGGSAALNDRPKTHFRVATRRTSDERTLCRLSRYLRQLTRRTAPIVSTS